MKFPDSPSEGDIFDNGYNKMKYDSTNRVWRPVTDIVRSSTGTKEIWSGTQTEYDNLSSHDDSIIYFIKG